MKFVNPTTAPDRIADAIWWLKGFSAAQKSRERSYTDSMARTLGEVKMWLERLPYGLERLIGQNERALACVITEHELEVIIDGLRGDANDRELALTKVRAIHTRFREEAKEHFRSQPENSEVVF